MSEGGRGGFLGLFEENPHDIVVTKGSIVDPKDETGMDRLRRMFSLDEYGYQSKELTMITQSSVAAVLLGGCIGAVIQSRETYVTFLENNQATKYVNATDAKRELQRVMYLAFAKGAYRWGWRIGGFSCSFVSMMTIASVYFGKESLLDYVIAGGITGSLFKVNMGLKGMIAGCAVGSFLGTLGGTASLLVLKAGGKTMDELREFSKTMKVTRDESLRNAMKEHMIKEYTDFTDATANDEGFKNLKEEEGSA